MEDLIKAIEHILKSENSNLDYEDRRILELTLERTKTK